MNITDLSEREILALQYSLLEELKQKPTNNVITATIEKIPTPFAEEFIKQRFTDKDGCSETNNQYLCRLKWFELGCPEYNKFVKETGYTYGTIRKLSSRYSWQKIRQKAIELEYQPKKEQFIDNTKKEITRDSPEYKRYREKVLKRDGICQCCGNKDNLEVHHPLPYNQYPSLRADTSNGIVLCKECHDEYHHKHGYKEDANPVTLAQFLRDYGMNTQSKLLNDDLMQSVDDIVEDFVNTLFISPYIHINTFKEYADDISEDRWSICIDGDKWDTYIPVSEVRDMFYTYIHYLNNQKGVSVNIAYNTHKVKQAMERQGFNVITKNVYNEDGERSSIRVWDKCMLHPTNWDKLNEGMV